MSVGTTEFFVFPGAGSFGTELRPLTRGLSKSARTVRYPGRFGDDPQSFAGTVRSCVAQVREEPGPPVLVGHSFGAYLAYATAGALEGSGASVRALVVVGATAPPLLTLPESVTRSPSETAAYLSGVDPAALPDESSEWRNVVVETALHDLRTLREFMSADHPEVKCPVFAARGEDDRLTSTEGIVEWSGLTTGGCAHRVFPGGHSDLLGAPEFARWARAGCGRP
ncbi:alpha/beta fold hydrolase [Streptomyces sp. NPDC002490]|uniref:thioesterase II family protein n=1 Tax=Streptomyces sp. NPDC002490 TaxID=3154416 RepID=UPI0033248AEF